MNQYTAGALAELAGVSSRTVRYYDTKGILHPIGYTESGYRLYDDTALLKLQQISMLKFAGFSLNEIHGILMMEDRAIPDILEDQRQLLSERRDKINEVIELLDHILEQENYSDLSQLTNSMKLIRRVNHSSRTYRFCDQYGDQKLYPWEFAQLNLKPGMKILDLGCAHGYLWRHSWALIPEDSQITLVDIYSKMLESIQQFMVEHGAELSRGTEIHLVEDDVEIRPFDADYDRIVIAFLWKYLKNPEALIKKARDALASNGMLCFVHGSERIMTDYDDIYKEFAGQSCLEERITQVREKNNEIQGVLRRIFPKVEAIPFDNELTFTNTLELYRFMMDSYEELISAIKIHGIGFVNFLRRYVKEQGTVALHSRVWLYRCYKEEPHSD